MTDDQIAMFPTTIRQKVAAVESFIDKLDVATNPNNKFVRRYIERKRAESEREKVTQEDEAK